MRGRSDQSHTEETRRRMREAAHQQWQDQESRAKLLEGIQRAGQRVQQDPELHARRVAIGRRAWQEQDEETFERMFTRLQAAWQDSRTRLAMLESCLRSYWDPRTQARPFEDLRFVQDDLCRAGADVELFLAEREVPEVLAKQLRGFWQAWEKPETIEKMLEGIRRSWQEGNQEEDSLLGKG